MLLLCMICAICVTLVQIVCDFAEEGGWLWALSLTDRFRVELPRHVVDDLKFKAEELCKGSVATMQMRRKCIQKLAGQLLVSKALSSC
jgi:hypothetical protein